MKEYIKISILLMLTFPFFHTCCKSTPDKVENLIKEGINSMQKISIYIPCDEKKNEARIEEAARTDNWLPPGAPVGSSYFTKRPKLTEVMEKNNLLEIKKRIIKGMEYNFVIYPDDIRKYLADPNSDCSKGLTGNWNLMLGKREFKSIDKTEKTEAKPMNIEVEAYKTNFTYILTTNIPGLPPKSDEYKGTSVVYYYPELSEWKIENLKCNDEGESEYGIKSADTY